MINAKTAKAEKEALPLKKPSSPQQTIVGTSDGRASGRKPVSKKREQTIFTDEQPTKTGRGSKIRAAPADTPKPAVVREPGQASLKAMFHSTISK